MDLIMALMQGRAMSSRLPESRRGLSAPAP